MEDINKAWFRLLIEGGSGSGHHGHHGGAGGPGNPGGSTKDDGAGKGKSGKAKADKGRAKGERPVFFGYRGGKRYEAAAFGEELNKEASAWLDDEDNYDAPRARAGLATYVNTDWYENINYPLRHGRMPGGELGDDVKGLDKLMKNSHVHKTVRVARGIDYDLYDKLEKMRGKTFVDKGFVSTTLMPSILNPKSGKAPYDAIIDIIVPKGTPAYYVNRNKLYGERTEYELLLARGLKFKVLPHPDWKDIGFILKVVK